MHEIDESKLPGGLVVLGLSKAVSCSAITTSTERLPYRCGSYESFDEVSRTLSLD